VLAILAAEGLLSSGEAIIEHSRLPTNQQSGDNLLPERLGMRSRSAGWLSGTQRLALSAMVASFVVTACSLRWAEWQGPDHVMLPDAFRSHAAARLPDVEMLDQWLKGAPTLEALSRLQRLPAPAEPIRAPARRGELPRQRRRMG
jgi:hypothetical protein